MVRNFFQFEKHEQIYMQLSLNLRAIVSQRLVRTVDGKRRAAVEILLNKPRIADLIKKGEVDMIKEAMEQLTNEGLQTFDQALFDVYEEQKITFEDALRNADSINDVRLRIKLESDTARKSGVVEDHRDFELEESDDEAASGMI